MRLAAHSPSRTVLAPSRRRTRTRRTETPRQVARHRTTRATSPGAKTTPTASITTARYYNPVFSRFVTEDPLEFGAGDPDLFGYVRNSPTNFVDPNGTILPWIGACAGGAAFNAALTLGSNLLAGRKNTLSQTLSSALIGCAFGLAVLGVGPLFAAVLRPALTAAALGPTRVAFPIVGRVLTGYTKHGIEQAILNDGVGVAPRAILDAVRDPLRVIAQSGGRQLFVGRDAAVVLNAAGKVITTWARSHAGWRMP